ncbi:MAG: metal-dependent hydrolase [Acidobacteriaceae bacterium]
MEPVTHLLTGACLSRAGFNRKAAYATLTMVIAAEFPDIDTLWSLRGPIEGFQHHRGITHTFLGLPLEAALIVVGVYGFHRWRLARAKRTTTPRMKALTTAPVRWGVLYGLALVALLSHLLLDYTNNYGLRPFFPFNDHWYAASIVFIFDPVMFVLLLGALIAPWLFGLVSAEVGAKKRPFHGRGWAIAALIGIVGWWGLRTVEHQRAIQVAMTQSMAEPTPTNTPASNEPSAMQANDTAPAVPVYLPVRKALASPDMLSPFRWSAVMDFGPVYRLAEIDTIGSTLTMGETTYPKPGRSAVVLAAERSKLGRVYMDWSPMPFVEVTKPDSELASGTGSGPDAVANVVTFRDPRFMGGWLEDAGRQPLVGIVKLDAQNHVVEESMDGQVEP